MRLPPAFIAIALCACSPEEPVRWGKRPPPIDADTAVAALPEVFFEPIAVGFEFDGVLTSRGELTGYQYDGSYFPPSMFLVFASDEFFSASSEEVETAQSCAAWGTFDAPLRDRPLPTLDGADLFTSYERTLILEYTTCAGLVDPDDWGEDAGGLTDLFQGMRLGLGMGTLTASLAGVWSDEVLDQYGPNMLASYVAMDSDAGFFAEDLSTSFAWEYDLDSDSFAVDDAGYLLPVIVDDLRPPDDLPEMYVRSLATWYPLFEGIDFDSL